MKGEQLQELIEKIVTLPDEQKLAAFEDLQREDRKLANKIYWEVFAPAVVRENDNPLGYDIFYKLMMHRRRPEHTQEWIEAMYRAKLELGLRGVIIKAFRGSTKTTEIPYLFTLFRTGHRPQGSSLSLRITDSAAQKTVKRLKNAIEYSEAWKKCFPHVIPDKSASWGDEAGLQVRDTRVESDGEWQMMREVEGGGENPTIMAVGVGSGEIIGRHPTNVLSIDDIHDEGNSRSAREMQSVKDYITSNVFPTIVPPRPREKYLGTWVYWVCTPWDENDAYAMAEATGQYLVVTTPVYRETDEDDPKAVIYDGGPVRMTWPGVFTPEELEVKRREAGAESESNFARMYLLDLSRAKGLMLRREWLQDYPYEQIDARWPVVFGVDPTSTRVEKLGKADYFSVSIGRKIPGGGVVLVDGFLGQVSMGERIELLKSLASQWHPQIIGVESVGAGREFEMQLLQATQLPVFGFQSSKSKLWKFETAMAPAFQFSRAFISSKYTPFISRFIGAWVDWDASGKTVDDPLDSTYYMLEACKQDVLPKPPPGSGDEEERVKNPFAHVRS